MPWRFADRYSISMSVVSLIGDRTRARVGYIYTSWYERMTAQKIWSRYHIKWTDGRSSRDRADNEDTHDVWSPEGMKKDWNSHLRARRIGNKDKDSVTLTRNCLEYLHALVSLREDVR
jgi:hypothetical protein